MTSCTIIISHFESLPFLHASIRQIRKYAHPAIRQEIFIIDQSSNKTADEIIFLYGDDSDIHIVSSLPLYSGYGIDVVLRNNYINTDYICQIHVDAFPIHNNWLYLPIKLIEENNFSFVGQLQFISKVTDTIYPSNPFFAMAQCYNVAKTETYKEMSLEAGFTRFHNRPQSGLTFNNNDWQQWASHDYNARGSDDDIVAFHWEDSHREHNKLGIAITGFIQPSFGRIIEDVVFHFGSCRESIGIDSMPELYKEYTRRINENYSDELIEEMVLLAKQNKPPEMQILTRNLWDGTKKESSPTSNELNNRIEHLKK